MAKFLDTFSTKFSRSQSKLSRKADVSLNTIQAMVHNPHHDAVLSTLDKLAKALGVNVGDLYEVLPDEECDGSGVVRAMRGEVE